MAEAASYLVVYDISSDAERQKVAKALEGFGFRIQESVFECLLTKAGKSLLQRKLESLSPETGFIIVYRLSGREKPLSIGARERPGLDGGLAFVV